MKIKCCNCDLDDKDEIYYKYQKKIYCYSCLEDYFHDELLNIYFEKFVDEECQEIENAKNN
jgi:hypothetical protein